MFIRKKKNLQPKTLEQLEYRLEHFRQMYSSATQEGRVLVRQKIQQLNDQINQLEIYQQ